MPVGPSYSVPSAPLTTISYQYDNIDDLLLKLLDNSTYLIEPIDIRDPVLSLWRKIEGVELTAASAASASSIFSNLSPSTITVGGITQGSTFSNVTVANMFNQLLYPYVAAIPEMSIVGATQGEFGDPVKLFSISLSWSVEKVSNNIQSITVDSVPYATAGPPWTSNVSGFQSRPGYHPVSPGTHFHQFFTMSVNDGTSTTSATTSFTWMNRIYWGTVDLSGIGNPNLTYFAGSASLVSSVVTDTVIENLNNELSITKNKTYLQIGGTSEYVVFAWPSSVDGALSPKFEVNGQFNNAFTRLRNNDPFTNQHGFTTDYEVWITNTIQNSPLDIIIT